MVPNGNSSNTGCVAGPMAYACTSCMVHFTRCPIKRHTCKQRRDKVTTPSLNTIEPKTNSPPNLNLVHYPKSALCTVGSDRHSRPNAQSSPKQRYCHDDARSHSVTDVIEITKSPRRDRDRLEREGRETCRGGGIAAAERGRTRPSELSAGRRGRPRGGLRTVSLARARGRTPRRSPTSRRQ